MTDPSTDPEYRAILDRCRAEPDEDTHRLVLADRLAGLGHGRAAEWMREMVAVRTVHALGGSWVGTPFASLRPMGCVNNCTTFTLSRGLVVGATCYLPDWLAHGSKIVAHPLAAVRWVTLAEKHPLFYRSDLGAASWTWLLSDTNPSSEVHIPNAFWRLMKRTTYDTERDALTALSDAAVKWAWLPF